MKMDKLCWKLYILLWKNMLLLRRHYIKTAFEILVPVFLFATLYIIPVLQGPSDQGPPQQGPPRQGPPRQGPPQHQRAADELADQHSRKESHLPSQEISNVYYSPSNSFTDKLMRDVQQKTNINITPVSSASALEDAMIGVLFLNDEDTKNLNYRFRSRLGRKNALNYFGSRLLTLQQAIDWSFIGSVRPRNLLLVSYLSNNLPKGLRSPGPTFAMFVFNNFVFGLVILCIFVIGKIVEDKQTGATELLKLMGLSRTMIWLTWFIQVMFVLLIIMSFITIFLKTSITKKTDGFLIWLFLMFSSIPIVLSWFMVTTLFSRAWLAMTLAFFGWMVLFVCAIVFLFIDTKKYEKIASCLLPSVAVYWGFIAIYHHEYPSFESLLHGYAKGMQFNTVNKSVSGDPEDMTMDYVFIMLFVDILVYGILTWYIEAIYPGKYGIPQPLYFPCTKSYWYTGKESLQTSNDDDEQESENIETPPENVVVGIRILNLRKTFKRKPAVDGVTIDIYQDQITVLLGHNGAGKTTTMSIMTGMIPATSGSVWINGHNIRTHLSKARESLGLCPQHDMLFNDLTVKEHLILFGMLKGLNHSQAVFSAIDILQRLKIYEKADAMGKTLSGGMKRRVSLGIALVGGSKVVILDEPTSGLDPEARRQVWDVLLALRGECTILITTHFMEEADVLGDRIAIMDHGRVQCYGTSLFLKNKYGTGYKLKLLTKPGYDIDTISQFVQSRIEDAKLKSQLGSELDFTLPLESKSQFAALFKALESSKSALYIDSIGVSITTMEDVFLKVGEVASDSSDTTTTLDDLEAQDDDVRPQVKGIRLLVQQTGALFIKKMLYTLRHWFSTLVYASLAILIIVGVMFLSVKAVKEMHYSQWSKSSAFHSDQSNFLAEFFPVLTSENSARDASVVREAGSFPEAVAPNVGVSEALLRLRIADLAPHDKLSGAQSDPNSINLVNNAILKTFAGEDYSITVSNQTRGSKKKKYILKIDYQKDQQGSKSTDTLDSIFYYTIWGLLLSPGIMFICGSFLSFPLEERVSGSKHLQRMTGVGPAHYWLTCFLWDFLVYAFVAIMILVVFITVDTKSYFGHGKEAGVFMLLVLMYGLAGIPLAYLFSYISSSSPMCLGLHMGANFSFGILALIMQLAASKSVVRLFYFIPHYNIYFAFGSFAMQAEKNTRMCKFAPKDALRCDPNYLEVDEGIGLNVLMLLIGCVMFFSLIMVIDYQVFPLLFRKMNRGRQDQNQDELDDDVRAEISRVNEAPDDAYALAVYDLKKNYGSNLAVKGATFGVEAGQCFGLLGFNGAGKTTTFKMLTGSDIPLNGDAFIRNTSLRKNKSKFLSQIGYCPQFDGINEYMTGREMLKIYAMLRGVHRSDVSWTVNKWLKLLGLEEYKNIQCGKYCGGNKRKLSTAMALIGDPPLIFLDEPTSGVDPVARRNLWTVLTRVSQLGDRAIVLTTHSMEECEALSSRLAIMVLGEFVCIGESQYLKKKFCQGFTVFIKLTDPPVDENQVETVKGAFEELFKSGKCVLKDERRGMLHYILTDKDLPWDQLFNNMEYLKDNQKGVQDYTVGETTLEQVFLSFAKK